MLNAKGPQDLIVYTLTKKGRVESSNYRTAKVPTGVDLPLYVRDQAVFKDFYKTAFGRLAEADRYRTVFTEYFWNSSFCDPCVTNPPTNDEIAAAGATWIANQYGRRIANANVVVTRLHLRYTPESFPEDLVFQETADREFFQARYVLRHPWSGSPYQCDAAMAYFRELDERESKQAAALARLTGWKMADIRERMPKRTPLPQSPNWRAP
jgi:hypothetical protein